MGPYSDTDIIDAVKCGDIEITNFGDTSTEEGGSLGPNSYDLRLGGLFLEVIWGDDGPWYVGPVVAEEGARVDVPVGGTMLAITKERVKTVGRVYGTMKARSSTGKVGISVCKCAGLGDIGYDNHWTMELSAATRLGQPFVTVGEKIAQMEFSETKSEPKNPYNGQYNIKDFPLCMVPKRYRHRIVARIEDVPGLQTAYRGGKISMR